MSNEYGEVKSVIEAINELHLALELSYMRTGMRILLEPDAFYRLQNEINGKLRMQAINKEDYDKDMIKMNTPSGEIIILKDEILGKSSYVPIWTKEDK
jgi:hypothetical protein